MAKDFKLIKRTASWSSLEAEAGVTVVDPNYPPLNWKRYGALGDGTHDDTAAIQASIDVAIALGGGVSYGPAGTYKITAALTITDTIQFVGDGASLNTDTGTIISNVTNDVECLIITDADRAKVADISFIHGASTKWAIRAEDARYLRLLDLKLDGKLEGVAAGFGGVFLGTTDTVPVSANFLSILENLDIRSFTDTGLKINSTGHTVDVRDCKVGDCGLDIDINTEHVNIRGGQFSLARFYNLGDGDIEGGSVRGVKIEGVGTGEYGIIIGGTTHAFTQILIEDVGANLTGIDGTLVFFERAKWCKYINPPIRNPGGGGSLCEWGATAVDCELVCGYEAGQSPITVHGSAVRATKTITGEVARSQVANITVAANLRTVLQSGVDELVGFTPTHNGVGWNYAFFALGDDEADSVVPPTEMGIVWVINDDDVTTFGAVAYDCRSGAAPTELLSISTDLEAITGALAGTTGTDGKVTVSAHTDGEVYVEARKGASNITLLFASTGFGVP